jgi:hypothetical protein
MVIQQLPDKPLLNSRSSSHGITSLAEKKYILNWRQLSHGFISLLLIALYLYYSSTFRKDNSSYSNSVVTFLSGGSLNEVQYMPQQSMQLMLEVNWISHIANGNRLTDIIKIQWIEWYSLIV